MRLQKKLIWYFKRFSVMQPQEIVHRVHEQLILQKLYVNYLFNKNRAVNKLYPVKKFSFCSSHQSVLPELKWAFNLKKNEIDELLKGQWKALGFDWQWSQTENSWHTAPDTLKRWPQTFFNAIAYKTGNPYGDIRVAWEPARLQQLIGLAFIAKSNDQLSDQAMTLLEKQLLSWIKWNPPLCGIHYISVMECALRILSSCYALDKVRDKQQPSPPLFNGLLQLVESHAYLIEKRLSLYSSAGNHTIAESVALIYAGVLFPEFKSAKRWKNLGLTILEQEAQRQILAEGGGLEQTFWYLLFITDLCGLAVRLLEHYGETPPGSITSAFARGRQFLNHFSNSPEDIPAIGDADNGYALSPFLRISWEKTLEEKSVHSIDKSGYTLICGQTPYLFKCLFDHAPLGMPPSFGHGHADALSLTLQVGTENILIDSGTYTYTGEAQWRQYFRSTKAHNTIVVDHQDQAYQETAFMWSNPFQCQLIHYEKKSDGGLRLLAKHNGYQHLDNIIHWRGLVYYPAGSFLIWDHITGKGNHHIELNWHCSIDPFVAGKNKYVLKGQLLPIMLSIEGSQSIQWIKGQTVPIIGWHSPLYGHKRPINTLIASTQGELPQTLLTRISLDDDEIAFPNEIKFFESLLV